MTTKSTDADEIRALVAQLETSFNAKDADGTMAAFDDDPIAITSSAGVAHGRGPLLDAHRRAYAGPLRDVTATYRLADLRFVGDEVALATVETWPDDTGPGVIALHVLVRRADGWRVAARQMTAVTPS